MLSPDTKSALVIPNFRIDFASVVVSYVFSIDDKPSAFSAVKCKSFLATFNVAVVFALSRPVFETTICLPLLPVTSLLKSPPSSIATVNPSLFHSVEPYVNS